MVIPQAADALIGVEVACATAPFSAAAKSTLSRGCGGFSGQHEHDGGGIVVSGDG